MSKTNSGLVAYAKAQVGLPYWYGTYGQTATESLYKSKKAQYPSYYTASDFSSQYGKRVHDCVGLIKGYLWSDSATGTPTYNSAQDKSAGGMYAAATTKGKISTFPGTAGLLVFKGSSASSITHVGVYDGNGYVYEAKGHAYGTLKTVFKSSDWPYWAQCPYCTDDTSSTTSTAVDYTTVNYQATVKVSSSLNCRDYPGTSGTVVKKYYNGEVVTITREYNGWGYTGEGWISLSYVTKITTTTTTETTETQEDDDMITLEQFKELMGEYRTELRDNDSGTWSEEARQWCIDQGIFQGGDTTSDGNPNYMWEDMMTREQVATVLYRFAQLMGKA